MAFPWMLILQAALGVFAGIFILFLIIERDVAMALERTLERFVGTLGGMTATVIGTLVVGFGALAQFPEFVVGLVGLGALIADVNWPVAGVLFLVTIVTLDAIKQRRSSA